MPATAERIGFITREFRLATAGPDAGVEATFGDAARDVSPDEPIETFFASIADAQAMADERLDLLRIDRRRWTATLPQGAAFALALDYSQQVPRARVIDEAGGADRTAFVTGIRINLRTGAASLDLWG